VIIGIGLKILSTIAFTVMSALIRAEAGAAPLGEVVFFRSLPALAVLILWLHSRGEFPRAIATKRPFGHILRGLIGSGGMFFNFAALALLPLPDATAISFAAPLVGVALAAWVLREKVYIYRWSAVIIGFFGVLVMLQDQFGAAVSAGPARFWGSAFALTAAVCAAAAMTQTRRLTQTEQTGAIVFYFSLLTTVLSALTWFLPLLWPALGEIGTFMAAQRWVWPGWNGFFVLVMVGVIGGIAQIVMTESYRHADASVVAAFDYTSMIWATLIGYFAFGDLPTHSVIIGALIVAASGIFVLVREHQLGLLRLASRRAGPERPI